MATSSHTSRFTSGFAPATALGGTIDANNRRLRRGRTKPSKRPAVQLSRASVPAPATASVLYLTGDATPTQALQAWGAPGKRHGLSGQELGGVGHLKPPGPLTCCSGDAAAAVSSPSGSVTCHLDEGRTGIPQVLTAQAVESYRRAIDRWCPRSAAMPGRPHAGLLTPTEDGQAPRQCSGTSPVGFSG